MYMLFISVISIFYSISGTSTAVPEAEVPYNTTPGVTTAQQK